MFNISTKSMQWGEETLTLETGKVARQADGSVIATLGETSVMANVTFAKQPKPGQDFFPLTVHYQEKYYAAGKVPGGFFKREARPTEKETLTARLIDRPIRPLFVPGFKNEVLVMCTVLSHDLVNDPDIVAMIAASAALTISGAPFMGPIAGCRVGIAILGVITGLTYSIRWMEKTYGANVGVDECARLALYTATPMLLAGFIGLYPMLWLCVSVGMLAVAFSVYLLYTGVPVIMHIEEERAFMFSTSILTVGLVALVTIMGASVILWSTLVPLTILS